MMRCAARPLPIQRQRRNGVALIAVLYFLVVCALTTTAVLYVERSSARTAVEISGGFQLIAAAEDALYQTVAEWNESARRRQAIGSTVALEVLAAPGVQRNVYVTRLTSRLYSIVAEARTRDGAARRINLIVRVPRTTSGPRAALVSAADVTLGPRAYILADSAPCGDTATSALVLAPNAALNVDPELEAALQRSITRDSAAADSATYLRVGDLAWSDLIQAADIRLASGSRISPQPVQSGTACHPLDSNWGDPTSLTSPCATHAPLVFANGDLTIDGGLGQGVLLVDGHLAIAGPFRFSGQIVARGGIETRADNIAISGAVYAWRARSDSSRRPAISPDVVLTHATTLRYSGCDAYHGIASQQQLRRVHERAWIELF